MIERHRVKAHPRVLEFYAALHKRKPSSTEQASVVTTLADLIKILDVAEGEPVSVPPSSTAGVWIEKRPLNNSSSGKRAASSSSSASNKASKIDAIPSFFSPTLAVSIEEEKRAEAVAKASKTDVAPVPSYTTKARFSSLYYDDFFEDKGYTVSVETSNNAVPPSVSLAAMSAASRTISSKTAHSTVNDNSSVVTDTKTVKSTISEEARLRIERNRLLAKEKLEQARERRRRETEEALFQVEQMNF